MSYDIYLHDDAGNEVMVAPFMGGGTVQVNPETMEEVPQVKAWLNVTSNYSHLCTLAAKAAIYDLSIGTTVVEGVNQHRASETLQGILGEGLRYLDERYAMYVAEGLELLLAQIDPRGVFRQHDDYWAPTPGNAAAALRTLVSWCHQAPDATFMVH